MRPCTKAQNLEDAERNITGFWLMWQKQEDWYGEIQIKRPRDFSIEDLAADLENALAAKILIPVPAFHKALMKAIVGQILSGLPPNKMAEIHEEIDRLEAVPLLQRFPAEEREEAA